MKVENRDAVIKAENLGKRYFLSQTDRSRRKSKIERGLSGRTSSKQEFWALKDLNFLIEKGESVGIIGPNGAGKTTLLKILGNVTKSTTGSLSLQGRVGTLIELGAGFHPELSGRENIFLSGSILGMKRKEIAAKFDEIVAFAELEDFVDVPVKRYSSGMYVRLGFAVAAHVDPDILIVDEVLSVGDLHFQKKCLEWVQRFVRSNKTFLLVSHQLNQIENVCQRVFYIKGGRMVFDGPPDKAISLFLSDDTISRKNGFSSRRPHKQNVGDLDVMTVELLSSDNISTDTITQDSPLTVKIHVRARRRINRPKIEIAFLCGGLTLGQTNTLSEGASPDCLEGDGVVIFHWPRCVLSPDQYSLDIYISDGDSAADLLVWHRALDFRVVSPEGFCLATGNPGFFKVPGKWSYGSK